LWREELAVGEIREKRDSRESSGSRARRSTPLAGGNKKKEKPIVNLVVEIQLLNLDQYIPRQLKESIMPHNGIHEYICS
jgi:hypothetical protein